MEQFAVETLKAFGHAHQETLMGEAGEAFGFLGELCLCPKPSWSA